jgi:hypothetical protein
LPIANNLRKEIKMRDYRYIVLFKTGSVTTSVEVYAGSEETATILAQAEMIKDGKDYKKIISISKMEK